MMKNNSALSPLTARRYLRTDEREEAVRSLEWAETQSRLLSVDPYHWKWVLISLHNAVQGFLILALWNGNGLLTLSNKGAAKWLDAYNKGDSYPADRLDSFLNLYAKAKDSDNFHLVGAGPFFAGATHDISLNRLNEFRNEFIHFTPKGWSLELEGLPRVALDALDLMQFFGWESTAIRWHKRVQIVRAKRALKRLRRTLLKLGQQYAG